MLRTRHEKDRAVLLSRESGNEHVQPDSESEGFMRLLAPERDKVVRWRLAGEHVAVRDLAHGDVCDQRMAIGARDRDREWVRPRQRGPAVRMPEPGRRRCRERRREPAFREPPHPVTEKASRKRVRSDDEPRAGGRIEDLSLDDASEHQVAEGAVARPTLVAVLDDDALRPSGGVEVGERREPVDARGPVPGTIAPVGGLEMIGEYARLGLREAEGSEPVVGVQAETSGSGFTMPIPCSRFVEAIACARPTIACETSVSGSASTIGSPSSA